MLNRSKIVAALLLAVTFVVGAATGGVLYARWHRADRRPSPAERRERPSFAQRLEQDLGLTAAQRESVEVILSRRDGQMREMWRDMAPRFDSLRTRLNQEILAQLSAEQRALFEAMIARGDSARRYRDRRGDNER